MLIPDISPVQLRWQEARADDLSIHYLSGTPAERDIDHLKATALESLSRVSLALNERLNNRLSLYLVPRVFWQGGVALGDRLVIISYADRAYTGVTARDYFAHEIAHALTQRWGNLGNAGGILSEGVAVYASGGHYQPDLLDQSAATLAQSPLFIPLSILRRDFSNQQHEIAYTISGSFVRFLIDQHGLDNLRAIVRRPNDWRVIYGKDFDALAQDWLAVMQKTPTTNDSLRRWQLKVRYYDLLRRYEEQFDPDARRLPSAPVERWDAELRRALQAPADAENNRVLELMMVSAIEAVEGLRSPAQLELAERYMNEVERKVRSPQSADEEIMAEVRVIVRLAHSQDEALIRRDAAALQATLDLAGHPQFVANFMERAQAQPLWLRFTQSPVRIQLAGDRAYLTVAQWAEPLDRANRNLRDGQTSVAPGQRWVLALQKIGGWRIVGRWLDAPDMLKTNQAAR